MMLSRLGCFTSKSNKCATKIDEARQVLKVRIALICSLASNHTAPTLNHAVSTVLSQRESLGELTQGFGKGLEGLEHQQHDQGSWDGYIYSSHLN
jgi:predicted component of type VI protein secretion system